MQEVIIISTEHVKSGKCNSDELLKIIESIKPDVIFEEEPDDHKYHEYYSDRNSFKSLEIQTIIKYKQNHTVVNVPVDKPINEFASLYLLDGFSKMFRQYEIYRILITEHCSLRDKNGFKYLNSKECTDLNEKKLLLEKEIISDSGPARTNLNNLYNQFHHEVSAREINMIENIYAFAKSNKFDRAVFFLGYAHRESTRNKISELKLLNNNLINWVFYNE